MTVVHTELYPFTPISVIFTVFQVYSSVKQFLLEFILLKSDQVEILYDCWLRLLDDAYTTVFCFFFKFSNMFKGDNWQISSLKKVTCLSDTVKARFFKLIVITTMLGVYIFTVGLMTLTLFQGHRRVRNNANGTLCFLNSCYDFFLL